MIKSNIENHADAFKTFLTAVGFTQAQTSQTRYQFAKPSEPAENAEEGQQV